MGDVHVDGRNSPPVVSPEEMAGRFHGELIGAMPDWKRRLGEDPSALAELEHDVRNAFSRGADLVVAGLIALVMKQAGFDEACEETRQNYRFPLSRGRMRPLRIRLLGGLLVWVASLYCEPRRGWFRKQDEDVPGLHIELAQFGFGKGCSPALESRVSRQAALCPSLQFAQEELAREGLEMDVKTITRITYQCGEGMLALRTDELMRWRLGKLPAGKEFEGKRISVQIDGGRAQTRGDLRPATAAAEKTDEDGLPVEDAPGRSKKRPRQTFDAEWREPKLVTIFVHDEHGRMEKESRAVVDGTFLGPDATAELVAMHLHRLGCAGGERHVCGGRRGMDLGPTGDDRTAGQTGGADLRSPRLLPRCPPHFPGLGGVGIGRKAADAVVPRASHAAAKRSVAARGRGVDGLGGVGRRERGGSHRDRVLAQAWRSGASAVSDVSQIGPAFGQRCNREQHPPSHQSPPEEQGDVLARRACGRNAPGTGAGHFQTLGRTCDGDATTPSLRRSNGLEMGTPADEFQNLNADHQRSGTPRKRGKLATQNGIAPFRDGRKISNGSFDFILVADFTSTIENRPRLDCVRSLWHLCRVL